MNKVLFLLDSNDHSFAILPYLLKYRVDSKTNFIHKPYFTGEIDSAVINDNFKFIYNNTEIELIYSMESTKIDYVNSLEKNQYDKIFVFKEWNSFDKKLKSFENVEILYYKADENFHITDEKLKDFLSEYRIISSASISFENNNFYFEPLINLFVFYYIFGFDYLSYNELNIKKSNLMGLYYIPKYKIVRDEFLNDINNIFKINNIEIPTIYDTKTDKPQLITQLLQSKKGFWGLNHTAMYTDYVTSVCGFIFDTLNYKSIQGPSDASGRNYINEKALKAIMYSNLNIPFILDTNPNNFEILNELGFWFLNSEFYEFNTNKPIEQRVDIAKTALIASIEYLISLYKENNSDLNKTHSILVEKYGDKMKNNYNTFIKYLTDAPNSDKLINFILYGNRN